MAKKNPMPPNPNPPIADTPPFEWHTTEVGGGFFTLVVRCGPPQFADAIAFAKAQRDRLNAKGAKLIGGVVVAHHGQQSAEIPD